MGHRQQLAMLSEIENCEVGMAPTPKTSQAPWDSLQWNNFPYGEKEAWIKERGLFGSITTVSVVDDGADQKFRPQQPHQTVITWLFSWN